MKIKSLVIEDATILQELISQKLSMTISLPLPDIYNRCLANQTINLSNYSIVAENKFEFTSLSLYNFMVSEETFNALSAANLSIAIDGQETEGQIKMNKLLMAPGYKLAMRVPMTKTVVIEGKASRMTAEEKKAEAMKGKKGR